LKSSSAIRYTSPCWTATLPDRMSRSRRFRRYRGRWVSQRAEHRHSSNSFSSRRALNQKLPPEKRLRALAGDPAVDWDQIKGIQDLMERHFDRDASIASVMEKEVLSKCRKALMLFGTFHIMHGTGSAVSLYEKEFPNLRSSSVSLAYSILTFRLCMTVSSLTGQYPPLRVQRAQGWAPWI